MVVVQSLWIGKLTQLEILCIKSFLKNGIDFYLYTYDKSLTDALPVGTIIKDANEIMEEDLSWISKKKHNTIPNAKYIMKIYHDLHVCACYCTNQLHLETWDRVELFCYSISTMQFAYNDRVHKPRVPNPPNHHKHNLQIQY